MGLDIIAYTDLEGAPNDDNRAPDEPFAGIDLVGCYGGAKFRGHAYVSLLEAATGHDPFEDVPGEKVPALADALDAFPDEHIEAIIAQHPNAEWWRDKPTLPMLRRWYRVCADNGYSLWASW